MSSSATPRGLYYDRPPEGRSWARRHAFLAGHPVARDLLVEAEDADRLAFLVDERTGLETSGTDRQALLRSLRETLSGIDGLARSTVTGPAVIAATIRVDSTYLATVDPDEPMREDYARLAEERIPGAQLSVLIDTGATDTTVTAPINAAIATLERELEALPPVRKVVGPREIYEEAAARLREKSERPADFDAGAASVTDA